MYSRFGLTLMVNHACNLRCTYCFTGNKFRRAMQLSTATRAIDRAIRSLKLNGTLELGFFGGEPLAEAALIQCAIEYAEQKTVHVGANLTCHITTNGTLTTSAAWNCIRHPLMRVSVSHDGLPEVHDLHRIGLDGHGSSAAVELTIRKLVDEGVDFAVVSVVRPDTLAHLAAGLRYLHAIGVRVFDLSLDLWTRWTQGDLRLLATTIADCADLWADWLPNVAISWFDSRTAQLWNVPTNETARCGFGAGEIAVAPSGALYPCERLIGEDRQDNPMRLSGSVFDGEDFLSLPSAASKEAIECHSCALLPVCSTHCRCSNYIRTGDIQRPDGLLCWLDQICFRETARVLSDRVVAIV